MTAEHFGCSGNLRRLSHLGLAESLYEAHVVSKADLREGRNVTSTWAFDTFDARAREAWGADCAALDMA